MIDFVFGFVLKCINSAAALVERCASSPLLLPNRQNLLLSCPATHAYPTLFAEIIKPLNEIHLQWPQREINI